MKLRTRLFIVLALLMLSFSTWAQKADVYQTKAGAIKGYDPVAYFEASRPLKGNTAYNYSWQGATWYFVSAENRDLFKANPEKYAPQYGGYCAYAVAKGTTAKIDPEAWKIVDGKLYLNYDQNIQSRWNKNQREFIQKADANWPGVLKN